MRRPIERRTLILILTLLIAASPAFPGGTLSERSSVKFGEGAGLMNKLGGAATGMGLVTTTVIQGDGMRTRTGDMGEYIHLGEERVCDLDYKKERATCSTFAQKREQLAYVQQGLGGAFGGGSGSGGGQPAVEYEVEFDMQEIGSERVGEFETSHHRVVATVHPKGMTLEEGGGAILTTDVWIGPDLPVVREVRDFQRRYLEAIGLFGSEGMAQVMDSYPALKQALESFEKKAAEINGSPVKTEMVMQTVTGTNPPKVESGDSSGGLAGRLSKLRFGKKKDGGDNQDPTQPVERLRTTTEIVDADSTAGADSAAIPASFKIKNMKG